MTTVWWKKKRKKNRKITQDLKRSQASSRRIAFLIKGTLRNNVHCCSVAPCWQQSLWKLNGTEWLCVKLKRVNKDDVGCYFKVFLTLIILFTQKKMVFFLFFFAMVQAWRTRAKTELAKNSKQGGWLQVFFHLWISNEKIILSALNAQTTLKSLKTT